MKYNFGGGSGGGGGEILKFISLCMNSSIQLCGVYIGATYYICAGKFL